MRSVNKVTLIGNLTRDPAIKETSNGKKIVTFTLATNREWADGEDRKSLTEFHNIAVWGRLADICEKFLQKGKLIYLEGYLKTRNWETPEGQRVSRTEIVAYDLIMLNKRGEFDESMADTMDMDDDDDVFGSDIPEFEPEEA